MRGKFFLLTSVCLKKPVAKSAAPALCSAGLRFAVVFLLGVVVYPSLSFGQQPFPGMKVNGKIMNGNDTIQVCIGTTLNYENTGQNYSTAVWRFKKGTPATFGSGRFVDVFYNTEGIDSTVQIVYTSTDTASMHIFIKVNKQKPVAAFTSLPNDSCGNIPVLFNSAASQGAPLSYQWSFGDGGSDTVANPSYQFLKATGITGTETYQVKLLVTNSFNCSDSVVKPVVVKRIPDASLGNPDAPAVGFYVYNGIQTFARCINSPAYLFKFSNASNTIAINNTYRINWGDGSPDSVFSNWPRESVINHPYTIGQHTLTLTTAGTTGCIGIKKYNIFLGTNPAGGFASPGNTDVCAPGGLNFIISGYSNNTSGTTYSISVNDGTQISTFSHPPPDTVSHFFSSTSCGTQSGTYTNSFSATLIIANPCLTTSVDVKPILVSTKPRAGMSIYPSPNVCTNSTVSLSNSSSGGNTVTSAGNATLCAIDGKQVWEISPSTGFNITYGTRGSTNNNPQNSNLWTNGSQFLNIVFTLPGTYTVKLITGTDRCGVNEITRTICVRSPPQASFTMNKKASCGIDTAIITNTSPTGGCLGDTYKWEVAYENPQNCGTSTGGYSFIHNTHTTSVNPVLRFSAPGRYIVTLTASATSTSFTCQPATFRDTFWVKDKPKSSVNSINTVCLGNPIAPTATVGSCYGSTPVTYEWNFGVGVPVSSNQANPGNVLFNTTGSFPVILNTTNECGTDADTVQAIITSNPEAKAGTDKLVCSNNPVQIGAPASGGLTYQWTPSAGLSNTSIAEPTATLTYSGPGNDTTYTFVVKASAGTNCSGTDTVLITVKKNPVVALSPGLATVCAGSGTQLAASGAASYSWLPPNGLNNPGTDTVIATPASTTTYTVTGTADGCSSSASATVSVITYPVVEAGRDSLVCNNSTPIQLSGSPAGGTWSGNPFITSGGLFNPRGAGNGMYTVTYAASNGSCEAIDSTKITVIDAPVASAGRDTTVCQSNSSLQLTGLPGNGRWTSSNLITASGQFTPSAPGTYSLVYTFGGGSCINSDTMVINVSGGIVNNSISNSQSICTGTQAGVIIGQAASGGSTAPSYKWQLSTDNLNWSDIAGATDRDYTPPILTQTTWYRRIASTLLCSGSEANVSAPVKITVNADAIAAFNPLESKGCTPFVITPAIINLSLDTSVSEYRWHINGSYLGSGEMFPDYTMNNNGDSITIKLVAISRFGCKNDSTEFGFTTVEKPVPAFTLSQEEGCGPITALIANVTPNASSYKYEWNFGQGQASSLIQPGNVVFPINPNYGDTVYTVTMKTISACDTIIVTGTVKVRAQPKVLFTPDRTEGCSPMKVSFTNTSRGSNANYVWDFNDGTAPVSSNSPAIQHTFNVGIVDTFYVKLKGANDCAADSMVYAIVVNPNSIRIDFAVNGNERFGCAPHTVRFINNTSGANSFTWNFGDGNILNTTRGIDTVVHTFNDAGNYSVNLLAVNSCNDTSDTEPITVQVKPAVSFTANPLVACVTDTIRFNNTSDAGISNVWRFGDGSSSAIRNPAKAYTVPGNYRIWLTGSRAFSQGLSCSDSAYADLVIRDTLQGSFAVSDSIGSCTPFSVSFSNSVGPSSLTTWTFADGTSATGDNVSHTFTSPGIYDVVMISRGNGGCTFKAVRPIRVTAPVGRLIYTGGFVCSSSRVRFEVRATDASQYRFIFGDGDSLTTADPIVFHQYQKPGNYVPYAYMIAGNCLIKISTGDTIKADRIDAGFSTSTTFSCGSTAVQFTDTSRAYFGMQSREWNFGDGTMSSLQNPAKNFTQKGLYNVRLSIIGASGCTDTATTLLDIEVRNFPVSNIGSDSVGCTGQAVSMAALVLSQDSVSNFSWSFGNNLSGSGRNVNPVYNAAGGYAVRLISTTNYGCADTVYKAIRINTAPLINAGSDVTICKGQSVQLQAFGANQWQWSPLEALTCTNCANPVAKPEVSTMYAAMGTNTFGCSVVDSVLVEVVQPLNLSISANDTICIGGQTQLFVGGATQYFWSPALGLSSATATNPIAQPAVTTRYQVIGKDSYNCFADTAHVTVAVGGYPTVNLGSGGLVVAGTPITMNPSLTNGPFKNYIWTPVANLSCINCPRPVATINTDISYKLEAENIYGCKASDTINYTVTCEQALQLYVPNAFSPDGDGVNDVLMVRGKGLASVKYFRIFNRWGQMVFERSNVAANDANHGWNGKVNGMLANPDVYVYTVEVICTGGAEFVKKGNVTLFR